MITNIRFRHTGKKHWLKDYFIDSNDSLQFRKKNSYSDLIALSATATVANTAMYHLSFKLYALQIHFILHMDCLWANRKRSVWHLLLYLFLFHFLLMSPAKGCCLYIFTSMNKFRNSDIQHSPLKWNEAWRSLSEAVITMVLSQNYD